MKASMQQFWNKLGAKERKLLVGMGMVVLIVGALLVVGQLTKPAPDPLTGQYSEAMKQAAKDIKTATQPAK